MNENFEKQIGIILLGCGRISIFPLDSYPRLGIFNSCVSCHGRVNHKKCNGNHLGISKVLRKGYIVLGKEKLYA